MSYYPIPRRELLRQIGLAWLSKANARKRENIRAGMLKRSDAIWSEVKPVYTAIQGKKCVFCDMKVLVRGSANADLEHFRPKGKIEAWPKKSGPKFAFSTGVAQPSGYYWLAYDPLNYASSCKHCNSALKRCFFPIQGARGTPHQTISQLNATEQPLLLFPFGPQADNPANFIDFNGIIAMAKPGLSAADKNRAEVTIAFFNLNQDDILEARMEAVVTIFERSQDKLTGNLPSTQADYSLALRRDYRAPQAHFANCYFNLLKHGSAAEKKQAYNTYLQSTQYLDSIGIRPG